MMNVFAAQSQAEPVAGLFRILGQENRVKILFVIGTGEACVCHLEAYLGLRQAVISQHLMALRDAGLVTANREGRNIYYRLSNPGLLDLLRRAAEAAGIALPELEAALRMPVKPCPCPHCNPDPGMSESGEEE